MQENILFLRAEITEGGKPVYELVDEAGNSKGLFAVVPVQEWEELERRTEWTGATCEHGIPMSSACAQCGDPQY